MLQHLNLPSNLIGLTDKEVAAARTIHGLNRQQEKSRRTSWHILLSILKEPMLILLVAISVLYFILGQNGEAWFMIAAIFIVFGISFYQDNRSEKALKALETLAAPLSHVIRNGISLEIPTEEIVPGDLVIADEGSTINADGRIVYSHDFSINESILTGESASQYKSASTEDNNVYSGTLVASGLAVFKVEKTGLQTKIGQLGTSLAEIKEEQTPLQKQIETFVRRMAISGAIIFLLVWVINYIKSGDILASLLKGLTLAMSILPEEIPVAFTTFMALGSWRLMRSGIIVKKTSTVETLGNATIICADKTGTITENNMTLHGVYALASHHYYENGQYDAAALDVIETAMWASEPVPFDPMEKTLHTVYREHTRIDHRPAFRMIHEYPLGGVPPRMTHIFENESKQRIIACKGAPEAFLNNNLFSNEELQRLHSIISELAAKGFRVLGVASAPSSPQPFPKNQEDFNFQLKGFVAFYDPPKKGIEKVFEQFYTAGLKVKIISGDNRMTTTAIAKSAGIKNPGQAINGEELMLLPKEQFHDAVRNNTIFTRMYPEAKLATV